MKKVIIMMAAGAIAASVSADLTQWSWGNAVGQPVLIATDAGDVAINTWTLFNIQGDVSGLVTGSGQVDLGLLISTAGPSVGPGLQTAKLAFQPAGTIKTADTTSNASAAGNIWGLMVNNAAYTSLADIKAGDFVGLTQVGVVQDLWPTEPAGTPGLPQVLNPGNVKLGTEVIPEPATIGLMGIAGLGMFLARKKARR